MKNKAHLPASSINYKAAIGAASLGAAGLICLQKVKDLVIENYLLKQHLHQQEMMIAAEEEAIREHLAHHLAPTEPSELVGFARALDE